MKLLTFTSALFVVVAAGALVVAAPSVEDAQGISLRNDIDSRGVLTFHPRGCNPPCRGCYKCALCDYGRPCCKRMSPKCPKAGAETINEAAVTEKRAAVDQAMSRREPVLLHARACTPGCKGCMKCALCDFNKPCCKRMSSLCRAEAGTEPVVEEVAVTEKRATIGQDVSSREPKLLRPRACKPPCRGCKKCALCDFNKPCCKRLSSHCGSEASTDTENETTVDQKRTAEAEVVERAPEDIRPWCNEGQSCPKGWECKPCLMGHCCKAPKKSEVSIDATVSEILEPERCPQQCQKCYFCVDCNGTPCCKRVPTICYQLTHDV